MRIGGQHFSAAVIDEIRRLTDGGSDLTRAELSRQVCDLLGWRSANGRRKEMTCRKALLSLERRGLIELPPARLVSIGGKVTPALDDRFELPQIVTSLAELGEVRLEAVDGTDEARSRRWWGMMSAHHPLGAGPLCGAQIRYFILSRAGILGGLSFSAPAWRVQARDDWIGWNDADRQAGLSKVVCNSRFLILPSIKVPHLASHVLSLVLHRLPADWLARYRVRPVLVETFVDTSRHRGTCYRAANWVHVGRSGGRGRQDRKRTARLAVKDVWLYPLARNWRQALKGAEPVPRRQSHLPQADWAEVEFGNCALGDQRLNRRLVTLARDFYAQPTASIPQACGGDRAKTKAAYRFLDNEQTTMKTLLQPHYQATEARMAAHKVVLAVQDSTSLNYTAHPATEGLGPIGNSKDAIGLNVHSTLCMTTDGTPLGFIDVQSWARDIEEFGKRAERNRKPIEDKESRKWLDSYRATAKVQENLPGTMIVSIGDREADIFELFVLAQQNEPGPKLLVRAMHNRRVKAEQKLLWPRLEAQPVAGIQVVNVPRQGSRAAREAKLSVRFAKVELCRPMGRRGKGISVWAVFTREEQPPKGVTPLEWMLLTTMPVETFEQAIEKLHWYTRRWQIEVLHRILKSGCRIENRQLENADRIEACLAIDLVVAWRIHHLNKLGRETPDLPCTVYFEDAEWKALVALATQNPVPPPKPPSLRQAIRLTAGLGGFLGRKRDGEPGTQSLWIGLQKLDTATAMWRLMMRRTGGTQVAVSRTDYG